MCCVLMDHMLSSLSSACSLVEVVSWPWCVISFMQEKRLNSDSLKSCWELFLVYGLDHASVFGSLKVMFFAVKWEQVCIYVYMFLRRCWWYSETHSGCGEIFGHGDGPYRRPDLSRRRQTSWSVLQTWEWQAYAIKHVNIFRLILHYIRCKYILFQTEFSVHFQPSVLVFNRCRSCE